MTPEELQAERDNCAYFTKSREGGYVFTPEKDFGLEFAEQCRKSKSVFLPVRRWGEFIGDDRIAYLFDPSPKHDVILTGCIGLVNGCELYTDAFVSQQARECDIPAEVVFVPR